MRLACSLLLLCVGYAVGQVPVAPKPLHFPPRDGVYQILVLSAVDGDTLRFCWLVPDHARLSGINTPELPTPEGLKAKAFVESKLPTGPTTCIVHGRDKYNRALLDVMGKDGKSLSKALLDSGNAKEMK